MSEAVLHTDDLAVSGYDKKRYFSQIETFQCGNETLNKCLKESNAHSVTTMLFLNAAEANEIVGYCSYCCSSINVKEKDGEGNIFDECYPAIEIKLFGVAQKYQGVRVSGDSRTVASYILDHCVSTFVEIIKETIYAEYIVLHALEEEKVVRFYQKNNFEILDGDRAQVLLGKFSSGCTPMYMAIPKELLCK